MAHRNTLKKKHKAFKTRHATKSSIKTANKGRVDASEGSNGKKHVMSKLERRNLKVQARATKVSALAEKTKIFDGRNGVARNVVIVPLTPDISSVDVAQHISTALEGVQEGMGIISIPKFHQRLRLFVPRYDNFFQVMDAARAADFVLFVHSAVEEIKDYGEQLIRCITSQGVSTSFGAIWRMQDACSSAGSKEKDVRGALTTWFSHFFPDEKLYNLENDNECNILGRMLCQRTPRGIHWRDNRAYIIPETVEADSARNLVITGAIRGKQLSPDEFMYVQGFGDFRIARIERLSGPVSSDEMGDDISKAEPKLLSRFVSEEEAIALNEADENEHMEGHGVRVDGHEDITYMVEANTEDNSIKQPKVLPSGTSSYQAAWFIEGEDYASDEDDNLLTDEEGELVKTDDGSDTMDIEDAADKEESAAEEEHGSIDDGNSDMEDDEFDYNVTREAKDDLEFPDEIEVDPAVKASERLRRYRGVRSIRHTDWDSREQDERMPSEYTRLYRPGNLIAKSNFVLKQLTDSVAVGTKVKVFLEFCNFDQSTSTEDPAQLLNDGQVVAAYALLPSEEKLGYVNTSITLDSEVTEPVKSKQPIIVQYGPRRMLINPLFSQGGDNNVYKFFRFLHPGRSAVVTFIGPVLLNNAPVVYYYPDASRERRIIGAGTVEDSDADRIIVKTAILTGLPVKIHRKLITIKHMFFNRDDVEYFKQVPLFTKLGAQGFIKEALGTHGIFKATFDKKIKSQDTIGMALYKRVWPKFARQV